MAVNYQNSTLSLTLPISCQICLGKVRQPVICANHHVFCSRCMETWLKNAAQCPTCREPITEENPCREIIGGTNDGDYSESPSMRKRLRKTRAELLLHEYEEEIDGLVKENKELRSKNENLEQQLRTVLDPDSGSGSAPPLPDDRRVSSFVMEEWRTKLQAATDVCEKIKQDMDKLRETNKALRSQNVDLVQENMRLKAEVASRSPQKFGRYTVAALEAKIQQYERHVDHLKRALERSDQYVDDLESRVKKAEKTQPEACRTDGPGPESVLQQQKVSMMMRSLSDSERESICSPGAEVPPSADPKNPTGDSESSSSSDFQPSTPSSAFRSLTLRSPTLREKKVSFKPATFLRRLDFDESPRKTGVATAANEFSVPEKLPKGESVLWVPWQRCHEPPGKKSDAKEPSSEDLDSFQIAMDIAYVNKMSELDSMMLDGESSSSRGSQLSLASSPLLDPEPQTCPSDAAKTAVQGEDQNQNPDENSDCETKKPLTDPQGDGFSALPSKSAASSQTEELSFDLLFDHLDGVGAGPSGSLSLAPRLQDQVNPLSTSGSNPVNTMRERAAVSGGQPAKRKSHSPFSSTSPTKLSKLM